MLSVLEDLISLARQRKVKPIDGSYTNKLLNCGADKVSINTAAVQNSKVVMESSKKIWFAMYCCCHRCVT